MAVGLSSASALLFLTRLQILNQKKKQQQQIIPPKTPKHVLLDTFQMLDLYDLQYSAQRAVTKHW